MNVCKRQWKRNLPLTTGPGDGGSKKVSESIADHAKDINIPIDLIVSADDPAITEEMTKEENNP